jgi:hypothetical protein
MVTIVPVDDIGMGFCTQTSGNCVGADDVFVVLVGLERRLNKSFMILVTYEE